MNLTHDLSFLKDVSKNDLKSIVGGGFNFNRVRSFQINRANGVQINGGDGSSSSVSSFVVGSSRNGVSTGSGRTSRTITVNGKVIESDEKSFNFGPGEGPFSISIENRVD
jgi:hypothetical protein